MHPFHVVLAVGFVARAAADKCYYPDGSTSPDVPCNSSATQSACCGSTAYCLSNGLCMSRGVLSRGSCTDENWDADECCPYCTNYNTGGGYSIMACTNTTFTCGFYPDNCAVDSSVFTITDAASIVLKSDQLTAAMEKAGIDTGGSSTNTDSSSSATSVSIVTVTATGTASTLKSNGYTAGQMAGVGVGVGVPLLLAIAGLSWALMRERTKSSDGQPSFHPLQNAEATGHGNAWDGWNQTSYSGQRRMPSELSNEQVVEIDTSSHLVELEPKYRA